MAISSPFLNVHDKKHWWLTNRKIVEKYVKDAKSLIASQEQNDIASALNLLEAALALSPRLEQALELKARCLLYLRRFKDVADMLQDYIPSLKMANDESGSDISSQSLSRERVKLLSLSDSPGSESFFKCFSVSELKKKVMAGFCKNGDKEGEWRYIILGQACSHLGLMEDAMALLQTGKRLVTAALRRQSTSLLDDTFSLSNPPISDHIPTSPPYPAPESETLATLISHIKLLIRRRTAALAALDAGLYSEAVRHFTKIIDGRRGAPQGFVSECYMHRASAYKSLGRIAESIADCNKTLALDSSCIQALENRALLLESIRCLPDCLHDLEHIKLLYNTILRDRKLPGPAWKKQNVRYGEISGKLCSLTVKIEEMKKRIAAGEMGNVDYYGLIGLRRGCSRSELDRAYLLLCLRHKPDKAMNFIERCELGDERDIDSVKERAKMSGLLLYRLIQNGYTKLMGVIRDEEEAEKQTKKVVEGLKVADNAIQVKQEITHVVQLDLEGKSSKISNCGAAGSRENKASNVSVFQEVFCRDIAAVGHLLSQVGLTRSIPVKYEALSC